jgi:hypothetical protein
MSSDHDAADSQADLEQGEAEEVTLEEVLDGIRQADADSTSPRGACLYFDRYRGKMVCFQTTQTTCQAFRGSFKPGRSC